jgi:ribonuclease inhibitor
MGDTGASLISEAVRETATLKTLILYNCDITSRGAEDLSRALAQNSSLEKLDIGVNNLGDEGISHIAEALKQNKQLKELWIGECGMTDKGAASLASALTINNSLKRLHVGGRKRALTEDGLSTIAHSVRNKSLFMKLAITSDFGYITANDLSKEVNEARERNGLPPIEIEGEYTVCCVDVSYQFIVFLQVIHK